MGSFATGVAVVTTEHAGALHGMTVNSLTSVSLEPLVLLVCLARGSRTADAILHRGRFAVNLLSVEQEVVSRRFVSKQAERFESGSYSTELGVPLLSGALAHIVCELHTTQIIGDHLVVFGEVVQCRAGQGTPLLYWRGRYATLNERVAHQSHEHQ
jgi:flavin reductase (DIM6/NTAB) family NADH-FMN oxidoreductase RutF